MHKYSSRRRVVHHLSSKRMHNKRWAMLTRIVRTSVSRQPASHSFIQSAREPWREMAHLSQLQNEVEQLFLFHYILCFIDSLKRIKFALYSGAIVRAAWSLDMDNGQNVFSSIHAHKSQGVESTANRPIEAKKAQQTTAVRTSDMIQCAYLVGIHHHTNRPRPTDQLITYVHEFPFETLGAKR